MHNRTFAQLTDEQKARKFNIAIRNHTDNLLTAEQISALVQGVSPTHQYSIAVHPVNRDVCRAQVTGSTLHIFIPKRLYRKEIKT